MHPEIQDSLTQYLEETFPESQRIALTPEQVKSYTLECRIWAIREPEAFEGGVEIVIEHLSSEPSSNLVADLSERYSTLQIAWIIQEAIRRYLR